MDDKGFAQRVVQLEPLQLYTASLESILLRCQRTTTLKTTYHDLCTALQREKAWLKETGQWPIQLINLEAVLKGHLGASLRNMRRVIAM